MRAAMCRAYGPPDNVVVEDVPAPGARPGLVVVGVEAAAVNFPDVLVVADKYQVSTPVPFIPGSEFAGRVVDVGDGSSDLALGDAVYGAMTAGAFAEQVAVPPAALHRVPPGTGMAEAAAFGVAYSTAYHALRFAGRAQPGEWIVVLGAAGGVGLAAVEIAHLLGCRVLAAASSAEKLALCAEMGADAVVDYTGDDLRGAIRAATGGGADVVIDPVGGPYSEPALRACRPGARFVVLGFAAGEIPRIPLNVILLKGVSVVGFVVGMFGVNHPADEARGRAELEELWAAGQLHPHIGAVYPLDQAAAALRLLADRKALGKVVIDLTA